MIAVSCPIEDTYLIHEASQRPVEGVAVYLYSFGWVCQKCTDGTGSASHCTHIKLAIDARLRYKV